MNSTEISKERSKKTPSIKAASIVFSVVAFLGILLSFSIRGDMSLTLNLVLSDVTIVIIPIVLATVIGKYNIKETFKLKVPKLKEVLLSFLVSITFLPVSLAIASLAIMIIYLIFGNISLPNISLNNGESKIILFICIAIMPAIFEESLFRGIIQRGMEKVGVKSGIVLTGLLFGLFHMDFQRFISQALLGMVCAYVVYRSGSIICSMIIHFTNNAIAALISLGSSETAATTNPNMIDTFKEAAEKLHVSFSTYMLITIIMMMVFIVIFAALSFLVIRKFKKVTQYNFENVNPENTVEKSYDKRGLLYLIPGILIIFAMYTFIGIYLLKMPS